MKNKFTLKRLLSLLVCLSMVLGMLPMLQTTKASAAEVPTAHDCSDWTQIQGEISSLSAGSYVLSGDVTLTAAVRIDSNVKICLNGNTITGNTAPYFNIVSGGTLTVFDCSSEKTGKIQGLGTAEAKNDQFLIIIYAGGLLELNGGAITGHNTTAYGPVYANGAFTMNGGEISYCSGGRTGAVYSDADAPVIEINGGSIHHNTASTISGGILCYGANAKVTLNSGSIANNTAVQQGGGVFMSGANSVFTLNGGSIAGNASVGNDANAPYYYGGGLYTKGTFKMTGGSVTGNTTNGPGAGVFIGGSGQFKMSGGVIANNSGTTRDNNVEIQGGSYTISGNAQIDQKGIQLYSATGVIQNLTENASVYAKSPLTYDENDTTVKVTGASAPYLYTFGTAPEGGEGGGEEGGDEEIVIPEYPL